MSKDILNLEPKSLWKSFYELTQIPRPSKKERGAVEFVKEFGEKLGLETIVDDTGNVIIKKPATKGMENRKGVVLQGHLDMVPQKNNDVDHDFEKDPIDAYVEDGWVTAKGTTLGSDNGMGVAAAMAVLEADDLEHGPVEALFTVDEETGMTGAFGLKGGLLDGDILINMDSEDEGELYVGCAGGMDTIIRFNFTEEDVPAGMKGFEIIVTGLKGGHSGLDIHLERGNSIKILNRLLLEAWEKTGVRIGNFNGGNIRNAIPREAHGLIAVPSDKAGEFEGWAKNFEAVVKNELASTEPGLKIELREAHTPQKVIDLNTQENLLKGVHACPNGVIGMIADMPGVVETSTSMGILKMENGKVEIVTLQRGSVDSLKDNTGKMIRNVFELAGAEVEHSGAYPGWKPNFQSPILGTMTKVYEDKFGKTPAIKVIHAGLECGIIGDVYPNLDLISFGPTIRYPHSPDEKVNIETVEKFWRFLVETLKEVPVK